MPYRLHILYLTLLTTTSLEKDSERLKMLGWKYALLFCLVSVLSRNVAGNKKRTNSNYCSVIKAGYRLSLSLYQDFVAKGARNLIFSPYSISSFTAMIMLGASGKTEAELRSFLQYGACNPDMSKIHESHRRVREYIEEQSPDVSFAVADRLFPDTSFVIRDNFTKLAEYYYKSTIQSLDYASNPERSRLIINEWIEDETEGLLTEILPPGSLDRMTEVVIANAIYFKDTWKTQFNPRRNIQGDFHVSDDSVVETTFMTNKGMYKFASNELFSLVELPYNGDIAYMLIVLPKRRNGLAHVEKSLGDGFLRALNQYGSIKNVVVRLPKFKIDFAQELKETYQSLGVQTLFQNADFTAMTGGCLHHLVVKFLYEGC